MSIHISFNEDDPSVERLLHHLPAGDVRSTSFTLTPSGSRMPGNFLTVWLAHPRGLPCRRRRVVRVVDRTNEQHDDHDSALLASESYNELRELQWSSYRFCLPFLLDFLFLTHHLQKLHVHALRDLLGTLEEIRPERPSWPLLDRPYTFSLTSFECSAVLTGDIIARVIACSALTLRDLYLLIHVSEFDVLAPELPELPTLRNLTLLSADETFRHSLLQRFLLHFPRLTALTHL